MERAIAPISAGRMVGTAVTVSFPGGDFTILHHVAQFLRAGDVLVIERQGDRVHSCIGGLMTHALSRKGVSGIIVDGPACDVSDIRECGLPVWSRGISPLTTRLLDLGGSFNIDICCGGVVVHPGDVVIGDDDGLLILPREEARPTIDLALERQDREIQLMREICSGVEVGVLSGASRAVAKSMAE